MTHPLIKAVTDLVEQENHFHRETDRLLQAQRDWWKEKKSLETEIVEWRETEHKLSEAYIRLRRLLNAFDTPHAPTGEQVWEHTEEKLKQLINDFGELTLALNSTNEKLKDMAGRCAALNGSVAVLRQGLNRCLAEASGAIREARPVLPVVIQRAAQVALTGESLSYDA